MKRIVVIVIFFLNILILTACSKTENQAVEYSGFEEYKNAILNYQEDVQNIELNSMKECYISKFSCLIINLDNINKKENKYSSFAKTIIYVNSHLIYYNDLRFSRKSKTGKIVQIDTFISYEIIDNYFLSYHHNIISIENDDMILAYVYFKKNITKEIFEEYSKLIEDNIYIMN